MRQGTAFSAVLRLLLITLVLFVFFGLTVYAQRVEHYNSPLYAPKTYDPSQTVSTGLPKELANVGIEQKLDNQLPLDVEFKDETGKQVKLGEFFNKKKPVIFVLVYYDCPMLCNEVLNNMTGSLKGISFDVGKEFDVVAVSFDARENDNPDLARNKKESYVRRYGREGSENGWHFLTGTQSSIDAVTDAVGFKYKYDEKTNQFAHAGGFVLTTPEGRISKYFYGVDFAPKEIKFGLMESSQSKIGTPVDQLMLYCFHYDPATGTYGFAVLRVIRIVGVATLLGMGAMFFVFWRKNKKKDLNEAEHGSAIN